MLYVLFLIELGSCYVLIRESESLIIPERELSFKFRQNDTRIVFSGKNKNK